jgi:CheY-like chemotaxis protein
MDKVKKIWLAEDDDDDFYFFKKALDTIDLNVELTRAKNGFELMELLKRVPAPEMVFLDINMPLKNGFQCLTEIRAHDTFKRLPVIIFSTSSMEDIIRLMFNTAANGYIVKPNNYHQWKRIIEKTIHMDWEQQPPHASFEKFVLSEF